MNLPLEPLHFTGSSPFLHVLFLIFTPFSDPVKGHFSCKMSFTVIGSGAVALTKRSQGSTMGKKIWLPMHL